MMTYGKYIPWFPVKESDRFFFISKLNHTLTELIIELTEDKERKIKIIFNFPSRGLICKTTEEHYRSRLDNQNIYTQAMNDYGKSGDIFIVEDSQYMRELAEESALFEFMHFKHYFFRDSDWTIDIASTYRPDVYLLIDDKVVEHLEGKHNSDVEKELEAQKKQVED